MSGKEESMAELEIRIMDLAYQVEELGKALNDHERRLTHLEERIRVALAVLRELKELVSVE